MLHHFATPTPPRLAIDLRAGFITIDTADVAETTVDLVPMNDSKVTMEAIAAATIEQRGVEIVVNVPHRFGGFGGRSPSLALRITTPHESRLGVKTGSAKLVATGRYGTSSVDTGSGDITIGEVTDSLRINTGSGDVHVESVAKDVVVRSGSGDVEVGSVLGEASFSTGSGDMRLDSGGRALGVKTGSGNVTVGTAPLDLRVSTASGDTRIETVGAGEVRVKAASGDIKAGVRTGTAAWLDVRTVSGRVASALESATEPDPGQPTVRLDLQTVSGDIQLVRV